MKKTTQKTEVKFTPLIEKDVWMIRLLNHDNVKGISLIKNVGTVCDGKIYVDLGDLSDYEAVATSDGNTISAAEILKKEVIGRQSKYHIKTTKKWDNPRTSADVLYAVVVPTANERPDVHFGILHNGELYEGGENLIRFPLTKSIHTHQEELRNDLYDTYDSFSKFILNIVKEQNLRPAIEEKYGTENDEFYSDDFYEQSYVQIRKPKGKPISKENIIIAVSEPWSNMVKI